MSNAWAYDVMTTDTPPILKRIGECTNCGNCCQVNVGFGMDSLGFCTKYDHDAKRCSVYQEERLDVCVAFPVDKSESRLCKGEGCFEYIQVG